jgi:hypothetical protein
MGGTIKIRFPSELWWDTILYENALKWNDLRVTYLTDTNCFVDIVDSRGIKTHVELYREDYDKIMNQKAFRLKFDLKKHGFKYDE